jgi:AraC-like DNA-binding protein/effector-binding domain-containing protein
MLKVARLIQRGPRARLPLPLLAASAGLSPFHLQREFRRLAGESPAGYTRRLRLLRAQTELLGGDAPLLRVARLAGFSSAEVLIRNFRRAHGCTPEQYRQRHRPLRRDARFVRGLALANRIAPCQHLYHLRTQAEVRPAMPMLSVDLRTLSPQPALIIRSRIPRSAIAATIGASLGRIVPFAMGAGGALAGQPFARYPEFGIGMVTIEVGMPLAAAIAGKEDIEAFTLPAGRAAVAMHGGSYEQLPDTYAALERWMSAQKLAPASPPWEVYVNDPAEHPDPANWRTEIFQPLR